MALPPNTTPAPTTLLVPVMSPAVQPPPPDPRDGNGDDDDTFVLPKLRLEIRDLSEPGASIFLSAVHASEVLASAARNVLLWLYASPSCPTTTVPPTRSVTLILRDMDGVAYTTGSDLDSDHKEVHFSTRYIAGIKPEARRTDEITGVLTHELVHCFQYNGQGDCPSGLIEGIADWVRLRCGLAPPHWKREAGERWDAGYQKTAYFLDYLEGRFGDGTVQRLNESMRIDRYGEKTTWDALVGRPVDDLWSEYTESLKDEKTVVVNRQDAAEGAKSGE
ncbi:hypothetical protein ACO1O0_003019 [Amphichorda felina]